MPGSKTYTSSKWTELLEADIEQQFKQSTHPGIIERFGNAIIETMKIAASAIVPIYFELVKGEVDPVTINATSSASTNDILTILSQKALSFVAIFAISYIVVTLLHATFKFLWDALLNSRMFPSKRIASKNRFHRVTTNYIMLSMSFENKMREYVNHIEVLSSKRDGWSSTRKSSLDTYIDMVCGYYAEAINYSSLALESLNEVLPPIARFGFRQYWNLKFCNYIGLDYIANSISMLENTLNRMQGAGNGMHAIVENIEELTDVAYRLDEIKVFRQRLDDNAIEISKFKSLMEYYIKSINNTIAP